MQWLMVFRLLSRCLQGLTDVIAEAEGLVAVTCFASNVALESIIGTERLSVWGAQNRQLVRLVIRISW